MRLLDIAPLSNADYLVTIEGLPDYYFSTFSGVEEQFTRPKYSDGLSGVNRMASTGKSELSNITLGKPFDSEKDTPLIEWLQARRDGSTFDVTVRPVVRGNDITFKGTRAIRLGGCRLMSKKYPGNVDTSSGDSVSTVEIEFHPETENWG